MTVLRHLLQPLWEISSEPVVITGDERDPGERRILYVNRAFTDMTGYSGEEAVGQPSNFLHGLLTDPAAVQRSEEHLVTGDLREYVLQHYRKNGSTFQCTITRAPLVDLDGTSEHLISIYKTAPEQGSKAVEPVPQSSTVSHTVSRSSLKCRNGKLPEHLPSHPELDALRELWDEVRSTKALPNRADFTLDVLARWVAHISIAVVLPDGRFQFRLFGSELSNVYGRDLTGCFLDELTPHDLWTVVTEDYREVVSIGEPLFAPISVSKGRWFSEVSRLLLPLSGNGKVRFVMAADYQRILR